MIGPSLRKLNPAVACLAKEVEIARATMAKGSRCGLIQALCNLASARLSMLCLHQMVISNSSKNLPSGALRTLTRCLS